MFSIKILGTHCEGCFKLITMTLEDYNFKEIKIDYKDKKITLKSPKSEITETENLLKSAFKELAGYSFNNLTEID